MECNGKIKVAKFVQNKFDELDEIKGGIVNTSEPGSRYPVFTTLSYAFASTGFTSLSMLSQVTCAARCGCPIDCRCSNTSSAGCINGLGKSLGAGTAN